MPNQGEKLDDRSFYGTLISETLRAHGVEPTKKMAMVARLIDIAVKAKTDGVNACADFLADFPNVVTEGSRAREILDPSKQH